LRGYDHDLVGRRESLPRKTATLIANGERRVAAQGWSTINVACASGVLDGD
jgi:hypothetical protein